MSGPTNGQDNGSNDMNPTTSNAGGCKSRLRLRRDKTKEIRDRCTK